MVDVLIPWRMSYYRSLNGYHPLVASAVETAPSDVNCIFPGADSQFDLNRLGEVTYASMVAAFALGKTYSFADSALDDQIGGHLSLFVGSRDPISQTLLNSYAGKVDLVFHHTAPLHLSAIPFVLHFESLTTLFFPHLLHGKTRAIPLRLQPIYHLVKALLESSTCRAIFTHLRSSLDILRSAFDSEIIAAKARYIRLGVDAPARFGDPITQKLSGSGRRAGVKILFTNSAHRHGDSFFLRGGLELLHAFRNHRQRFPDSQLTIVSSGRQSVQGQFPDLGEGVAWIEQGVDDERMFELLADAEVFALPAAGLHTYSTLRALKFGAVLVCSDAPGYDEFVADGQTGLVIPGRLAQVYDREAETGWMRDDYSSLFAPEPAIIKGMEAALDRLAADPAGRCRIALAARQHVDQNHALGPWVESIADLLRASA